MDSQTLLRNITQIRDRVSVKSAKNPITSKPVTIVAASKTQSAEVIRSAASFGINDFGKSAPYKDAFKYFGLTSEIIVKKIKRII